MNRIFLSGKISSDIDVYTSPKEEKIFIFSLFNEDKGFTIEVIYKVKTDMHLKKMDNIIVEGFLMKAKKGSGFTFKLEANKIYKMEV